MDITDFSAQGEYEFSIGNLAFIERVERLMAYLKAEGVLPSQRASETYPAHRSFVGAILMALDANQPLVRQHLDHTVYLVFGLPTRSEVFLDTMQKQDLLTPTSKPNVYRLDPMLRRIVPALTDEEAVNV